MSISNRGALVLSAWCWLQAPAVAAAPDGNSSISVARSSSKPGDPPSERGVPASADSSSAGERAKALFEAGRRLAAEARYEEACPLFEQSLSLEVRASIQYNLAECYERLGRTASAHALYLAAAETSEVSGQPEHGTIARRRASLLQNRLCAIQLTVEHQVLGQELRVGGRLIARSDWDEPIPVDPGNVVIGATAPRRTAWESTVEVESCPNLVSVAVPTLTPVASKRPLAAPGKRAAVPLRSSPPPGLAEDRSRSFPMAPVALATVGVGGILAGTFFAVKFERRNDDAKAICRSGDDCTQADVDRHADRVEQAKTARLAAIVGFGVGGAALAGAAWLYFGSSSSSSSSRAYVSPLEVAGQNAWGATVHGTF